MDDDRDRGRSSGTDGLDELGTETPDGDDFSSDPAAAESDERVLDRHLQSSDRALWESEDNLWRPDEVPRTWTGRDPRTSGSSGQILGDPDAAEELAIKNRAMDEAPMGITITDPDRPDNPLIYVNEAFERITGHPAEEVLGRNCRFLQGENSDPRAVEAMRAAIDDERPVSVELVNYRRDGTPFWNEVTVAPVRKDGEVTNFVGFQTDVTRRKRAERAVERERRALERVLSKVRGLVREVTREVVTATSLADLRRGVCEQLADTASYELVWIGGTDLGSDGIVPEAWAGDTPAGWGAVTGEGPDWSASDDAGPIAEAVSAGEARASSDPGAVRAASPTAEWVEAAGVEAVAGVPLHTGDRQYGLLVVYATKATALGDHELVLLASLGRVIATGIGALERARVLTADHVVEVELRVGDPGTFFVDLSEHTGSHLEYRGAVPRADGPPLLFFAIDADPDTVTEIAHEHHEIESVTPVATDDPNLYEFALAEASIVSWIADQGGRTNSIEVEHGRAHLEIELSGEGDPRSVVRRLERRYSDVDLVAFRDRERPPSTKREFVTEVERGLTDRQRTALRKAYVGGYYDPNRSVTGDQIAESMGISRATFHQHRRAAERKLIGELFEDG